MVSGKFKRLSITIIFSFLLIVCIIQNNNNIRYIESFKLYEDKIIIVIQKNKKRFGSIYEIRLGCNAFYDKKLNIGNGIEGNFNQDLFYEIEESENLLTIFLDWSTLGLSEKPVFNNDSSYDFYIKRLGGHFKAATIFKDDSFIITKEHYIDRI